MRFAVRVLAASGTQSAFTIEAADEADARRQAAARGVVLGVGRAAGLAGLRRARRGAFSLTLFSQELLALLEAGLTLVEALETLVEKETRPEARGLIADLLAALRRGQAFSDALQPHPERFPPLYVASVRASERTGDLAPALTRYVAYQRQVDALRQKVKSALIYPTLLLIAGGLVTAFLLGYVVPRFATVFEGSGRELPFLSAVLVSWGKLLAAHGWAVLTTVAVLAGGTIWTLSRADVRVWLAATAWRMPGIGDRLRIYQLARFYRTLGMLLNGGTPVTRALSMSTGLLAPELRPGLAGAEASIREGMPISHALESHGLATPVASRLLRVGEKSGRIGEMMERIAAFHDEDTARWIESFTRSFEPILMAVIGIVIGGIVVLLYLPVFELAGSLQ